MSNILKISKTFRQDDQLWHEARSDGRLKLKFRAPPGAELEIGDAIEFDALMADREALLPVYSLRGSAKILVLSADIKDLSDRTVKRELRFETSTVKLIATGEVEVHGPDSRAVTNFDTVDDLADHLDDAKSHFPEPVRIWLRNTVIPGLMAK